MGIAGKREGEMGVSWSWEPQAQDEGPVLLTGHPRGVLLPGDQAMKVDWAAKRFSNTAVGLGLVAFEKCPEGRH